MIVENEGFLWKSVVLLEDIGPLKKGRKGVCTCDLRDYDKFAVWFEEPIGYNEEGEPIYWATFQPWIEREKFQIIGDLREEMLEVFKPITDKLDKLK